MGCIYFYYKRQDYFYLYFSELACLLESFLSTCDFLIVIQLFVPIIIILILLVVMEGLIFMDNAFIYDWLTVSFQTVDVDTLLHVTGLASLSLGRTKPVPV